MSLHCQNCNYPNGEEAKECRSCGTALADAGVKREKKAPLVTTGFWVLLLGLLWIGSLIFGLAGAIPYGGGNGALVITAFITWGVIFWVVYQVLGSLFGPILRSKFPEIEASDKAISEPTIICPHCRAETSPKNATCAWCDRPLNEG